MNDEGQKLVHGFEFQKKEELSKLTTQVLEHLAKNSAVKVCYGQKTNQNDRMELLSLAQCYGYFIVWQQSTFCWYIIRENKAGRIVL